MTQKFKLRHQIFRFSNCIFHKIRKQINIISQLGLRLIYRLFHNNLIFSHFNNLFFQRIQLFLICRGCFGYSFTSILSLRIRKGLGLQKVLYIMILCLSSYSQIFVILSLLRNGS